MVYTHVLNRGGRGVKSPIDSEFSLFVSLLYATHQDGRNNQLFEALGIRDLGTMSFDKAWK
jgi:hypothetical protein